MMWIVIILVVVAAVCIAAGVMGKLADLWVGVCEAAPLLIFILLCAFIVYTQGW